MMPDLLHGDDESVASIFHHHVPGDANAASTSGSARRSLRHNISSSGSALLERVPGVDDMKSPAKPQLAGAKQKLAQGHSSAGRCDFQLQEDWSELQFLGALRAHFCYWHHADVALFIMRAVCGYDVVDGSKS